MKPPACFTMPYTVARPRPVPLPVSLVVKNGSKIRALVASSMPQPVSVTASIANRRTAAASRSRAYSGSCSTLAVSTVSLPPVGIASRAFTTRFMSTCSSCPTSARTDSRSGASAIVTSMSSPITRRRIFWRPSTTVLRLTTRGSTTCCPALIPV